ncbi:PQQ-binding-like beta-propeller repeat protein [Mycobacterium sp. LTG2003]
MTVGRKFAATSMRSRPILFKLMNEEVRAKPHRVRSILVGIGVGAAIATAVAAVIVPVAMWRTSSSSDALSHPLTGMGAVSLTVGVLVLIAFGLRLIIRNPVWAVPFAMTGFVAVWLTAWGVWKISDLLKARPWLPFLDSTGAWVLAVAAVMAAIAAAILSLATTAFVREAHLGTVLCVFVVAAVAVSVPVYRAVEGYRGSVWYPALTSKSAPPASPPVAIGPVRYRVSLDGDSDPNIARVGNGFVTRSPDGVTAYDGPTGDKRWSATGFASRTGTKLQAVEVVWRDSADTVGIVVLFLKNAVIALDGGTGEVMWRHEYTGDLNGASGGTDALGMTVFNAEAVTDRSLLYSLDPLSGHVRWSQPSSCNSIAPGLPGQFTVGCATKPPSVIDARTGNTTNVPATRHLTPGTDVYVSTTAHPTGAKPTDVTLVIDPHGQIVDQVAGASPVSPANNGLLLLHGGGNSWELRDYRKRQSTPVPIHLDITYGLQDVEAAWLENGLAITSAGRDDQPLLFVDRTTPTAEPISEQGPCPRYEPAWSLQAVPGALIAQCAAAAVVGLGPSSH